MMIKLAVDCRGQRGDGPARDVQEPALYWVDIDRRKLQHLERARHGDGISQSKG